MSNTDSDRLAISTGFAPVLKAAGYRLGNAEPWGPAGFIVRVISEGRKGAIIVTQQITDDVDMLHASIAFNKDVMPTYNDLALLHRAVFGRKRYAYQVFVPTTEHVSFHDTALHLWGRVDGKPMLPLFAQDGMI